MALYHDKIVLHRKRWLARRQARQEESQLVIAVLLASLLLLLRSLTPLRLLQLRDEVAKYKVGAPARVGLVAPNDVIVPSGNTGLDPSQTSFFQVRLDYQGVTFEALLLGALRLMACCLWESIRGDVLCWP